MKKLAYLFAAATICAACSEKKAGYTITGNVDQELNGDTVFLVQKSGNEKAYLDTAIIANGMFTFEGVQDSCDLRYISLPEKEKKHTDIAFFLENGNISVEANNGSWTVTGTPCNDAYREYKAGIANLRTEQSALYKAIQDTTLTEEQHIAKKKELNAYGDKYVAYVCEQADKNINNIVGYTIIRDSQLDLLYGATEKLDTLLQKMPEQFSNTPLAGYLRGEVEGRLKTAVGQKYTDIALKSPEGTDMKLSDYVGKNKVVLIDFWASWCGPCRARLPELKKIYEEYHDKGFEVVAVSLDSKLDAWKKAIKEEELTWPQMSDLKGWDCAGSRAYKVNMIPALVVIDEEGTIVGRDLQEYQVRELLEKLL